MPTWLLIFLGVASLFVALCSLTVSLLTYSRNKQWRDTDEGKLLYSRIEKAENWQNSPDAKDFRSKVGDIDHRLTQVETKVGSLATKADIAGLEADFKGLQRVVEAEVAGIKNTVEGIDAAIVRVEQFLMSGGGK